MADKGRFDAEFEVGAGGEISTDPEVWDIVLREAGGFVKGKDKGPLLDRCDFLELFTANDGEVITFVVENFHEQRDVVALLSRIASAGFSVRCKTFDDNEDLVRTDVHFYRKGGANEMVWEGAKKPTPSLTYREVKRILRSGDAPAIEVTAALDVWFQRATAATARFAAPVMPDLSQILAELEKANPTI